MAVVCHTYPAKQIIDPNKMCKNVISASRLFYIFTFGAIKQLHYGKAFQPRALVAIAWPSLFGIWIASALHLSSPTSG